MRKDYDIEDAFAAIEDELIESVMRNMRRHRIEEIAEDKEWEMWQALQLQSLEKYKKDNQKKFNSWFSDINSQVEEVIKKANQTGQMEQEVEILEAIKKGFKGAKKSSGTLRAEFFKLNEKKLEALIKATTDDLKKAEHAILRRANDQYRKAIFNAQVYANTGAGTYEKAVDMATKDMLSAGLNCVEYANGARHTLKDYADMAIRTASKRAYLQGEGTMRQSWGISTVIINKRGNACPKCLPFCGKVLIDDVWSGGKASDGPYQLISSAIAAGLYHPRCKDSHTTYFEGVSSAPDDTYTNAEIQKIEEGYREEQRKQYAKRQSEKFGRLEKYSLDDENRRKYSLKKKIWNRATHVVDTLKEHKPLKIMELERQYKKELISIINASDTRVQEVIYKYSDDITFVNVEARGRGLNKKSGIRVNFARDAKNARGSYTTTFHEIGHRIDRAAGDLSCKTTNFRDSLENDFNNIVIKMERMYNLTQEEAYSAISASLINDKYHSISDIVGGITKNRCVGRYMHEVKYWEKEHALEREAFAHFFEAFARNDDEKMNALSQMFPNAQKEFMRMLED